VEVHAFCAAGAHRNSGGVDVQYRLDHNYDDFIRRFFSMPAAGVLWPRTLWAAPENYLWLAAYLIDGTIHPLDGAVPRLKWGGRAQRFRLGDILPPGMILVITNWSENVNQWHHSSNYRMLSRSRVALDLALTGTRVFRNALDHSRSVSMSLEENLPES
jgi:hypothetical protein